MPTLVVSDPKNPVLPYMCVQTRISNPQLFTIPKKFIWGAIDLSFRKEGTLASLIFRNTGEVEPLYF